MDMGISLINTKFLFQKCFHRKEFGDNINGVKCDEKHLMNIWNFNAIDSERRA